MPRLLTFGTLTIQDLQFGREKPLLLLAYLCLNGSQLRRTVARQFWPRASNPMNSLSVALGQLKKAMPDSFEASETHVQSTLNCDALDFLALDQTAPLAKAEALYKGAFLAGLSGDDLGEELEEWVMTTREQFANTFQRTLIKEAHRELAPNPVRAAALAARAFHLPATTPPELQLIREIHALLSAGGHPDVSRLAQEAQELGLAMATAPTIPSTSLLGREKELEQLGRVQSGEALWVRGAAGLGKTALLRAAATYGGVLLTGRSGQAFQTLKPLAALQPKQALPPTGEQEWYQLLAAQPQTLLIDDWEDSDPESRRLILALIRSHSGQPVIMSSRERPPAGLPELLLRPIASQYLNEQQQQRTGGLPALLHAETRQLSLADAYAQLLAPHSPRLRQVLACLAVQLTVLISVLKEPQLKATCAALEINASEMAELLETLQRACLLTDRKPTAPVALQAWLETQPSLETEVLTLLAPFLASAQALPLYLRAAELTGASDFKGLQAALNSEAQRYLADGVAYEAETLLGKYAQTPENLLLYGQALYELGKYPQALAVLENLADSPAVYSLKGRILFRLGKVEEAKQAAEKSLSGNLEDRAKGYELMATICLSAQQYKEAAEFCEKSAGLFLMLGDNEFRLNVMCTQAVALTELGEDTKVLMETILVLSNSMENALTLLNIGWLFDRDGNKDLALQFAQKAVAAAEKRQQASITSLAWNNLGVQYQNLGQDKDAENAYQLAIQYAQKTKDIRTLTLALGNLAELKQSIPLLEEVILLLKEAKQTDLVAYFEDLYQSFMGRSGGS